MQCNANALAPQRKALDRVTKFGNLMASRGTQAGGNQRLQPAVCRLMSCALRAVDVRQGKLEPWRIERDGTGGNNTRNDGVARTSRMMEDHRLHRVDDQVMRHTWQPEISGELQRDIDPVSMVTAPRR